MPRVRARLLPSDVVDSAYPGGISDGYPLCAVRLVVAAMSPLEQVESRVGAFDLLGIFFALLMSGLLFIAFAASTFVAQDR